MVTEMCLPKGERWPQQGEGLAGGREAPAAPYGRRLPLEAAAPCPFFFLEFGTSVEELLPLLGDCQEGVFSSQWTGASKNRVSPQYIEVEMQSRPCDGCPFILRALGHP
jgi:hypothetical protein